jgi:hypothetical protein
MTKEKRWLHCMCQGVTCFTSEPPTQASRPPSNHFTTSNANNSAPPPAARKEMTFLSYPNPRVSPYMCENYVLSSHSAHGALVVARSHSRELSSSAHFSPLARHSPREQPIEHPQQLSVSPASECTAFSDSCALLLLQSPPEGLRLGQPTQRVDALNHRSPLAIAWLDHFGFPTSVCICDNQL